jgi:hypothetical protein
MKINLLVIIICLFSSCSGDTVHDVKASDLFTNHNRFDGQKIKVHGVINKVMEGHTIKLNYNGNDHNPPILKLNLTDDVILKANVNKKISIDFFIKRKVTILGTFRKIDVYGKSKFYGNLEVSEVIDSNYLSSK